MFFMRFTKVRLHQLNVQNVEKSVQEVFVSDDKNTEGSSVK